jgi:hypothetical protein
MGMNIKKLIREEMDDFEWTNDTTLFSYDGVTFRTRDDVVVKQTLLSKDVKNTIEDVGGNIVTIVWGDRDFSTDHLRSDVTRSFEKGWFVLT